MIYTTLNLTIHLLSILSLFILTSTPTHAYLDPGSGSFLIQILIAGFIGGSVFFRSTLSKLKSFFSKNRQPDSSSDDQTSD